MKRSRNIARAAIFGVALGPLMMGQTALAQEAEGSQTEEEAEAPSDDPNSGQIDPDDNTIVVRAIRGTVDTQITPLQEFDSEDIASFGAGSLEELVAAVAPQTTSGRGRGSGRPIFLLNGQRISSFRELRDLPPEAIKRVQVFPEEVALQYGFNADQRVINFILVDNFAAFTGEIEYGGATQGGRGAGEIEGTLTRINKGGRLNLDLEYNRGTLLTESERNIIQPDQPDADLLVTTDPAVVGAFRSLLPQSDTIEANASYGKEIALATRLQLNASFTDSNNSGLNGLNSNVFNLPAGSPFNDSGSDQSVLRTFLEPRPLQQQTNTQNFAASAGLTGNIKRTNWALNADYTRDETDTIIDRAAEFAVLQAQIDEGTLSPLDPDLGQSLPAPAQDFAESVLETLTLNANARTAIAYLPSGPLNLTLNAGLTDIGLDSENIIAGVASEASLQRTTLLGSANITVPLSERDGVIPAIGALSINANIGYRDVSDVGGLTNFGFGVNWAPSAEWSFQAGFIRTEAAPSIGQLGNPVIITPNVPVFDFTNNETVLATIISGGNPALVAEEQRDVRISADYRPSWVDGLTLNVEFFRNRSFDTTANFPTFTPEIEAAFSDRVVRDGAGTLVSIDRRAVNFSEVRSDSLRYGVIFFKQFGPRRRPGGRPGGGRVGRPGGEPGAGRPDAANNPAGGNGTQTGGPPGRDQQQGQQQSQQQGEQQQAGGPPQSSENNASAGEQSAGQSNAGQSNEGQSNEAQSSKGQSSGGRRPGFFGSEPGRGRWNISAFHRIRFSETVLIAPGVAELDLLNGSSVSGSTGAIRHSVELEGGWFKDGLGFRFSGDFQGPSSVDGGGLAANATSLDFNAIATFNLRAFLNFDNREKIVSALPFLKGSRLALSIDNIFDAQQDVRDQDGNVPLQFQPGFRDPIGRFVELSWRKRF